MTSGPDGTAPESAEGEGTDAGSAYHVRLERFQGPLDLLLFLIKRNEIDIYDIPIAQVTGEYLEYLRLMKILNLELAGEFLVMAATLMRIKARTLLPRDEEEEEEEEIEDPRQELVRLLVEHQHFQKLGGELRELAEREGEIFPRPGEGPPGEGEAEPDYVEATLFDLLTVFREALARAPARGTLLVEREEVTLEEMMELVRSRLAGAGSMLFRDLLPGAAGRAELVVMFLALLEMARDGSLSLRQPVPFSDIRVEWRGDRDPQRTTWNGKNSEPS